MDLSPQEALLWSVDTFIYTESLIQDKIILIERGRGGGEKKEDQEKKAH